MTVLGALAGAFVLVLLTAVALPGRARRGLLVQPLASKGDDQSLTALRSLNDLDRDRARGAVTDLDYEVLRLRLEAEAVRALRDRSPAPETPLAPANGRTSSRRARPRPRSHPRTHVRARPALIGAGLVVAVLSLVIIGASTGAIGGRADGGIATAAAPAIRDSETSRLEQAASAAPNDVEAHLALAQRYLELNRPADATRQYLAVLKLDPENAEASTRMALLVYEGGDSQTALAAVNHVLAVHPTHPEALFLKGVILINGLNRPAEAVAPLKAYLAVDPNGGYAADAKQLLRQVGAGT